MTLYELTGQFLALERFLEDADELDPEIIADTIEGLEGEYDDKAEAYAKIILNMEADAKALKVEAERLTARRTALETKVKSIKNALMDSMQTLGKRKAGGELFSVSVVKNGGKAPLIIDDEEGATNKYFKKVLDASALREAVENGSESTFAHIGERGSHLSIR